MDYVDKREIIEKLIYERDSLGTIIEDWETPIYSWDNKPFKPVFVELLKEYKIKQINTFAVYNIRDKVSGVELNWNMEDVNKIKNCVSAVMKFEPEVNKHGTMFWSTRDFNISIYRNGKDNIIINPEVR